MTLRGSRAALMLVVAVAAGTLAGACGSPQTPPVEAGDFVGNWCSEQKDRLVVESVGSFLLTGLSPDYFRVLQDDDSDTEEDIIKNDFGGVRPTEGRGSWSFGAPSTSARLRLSFDSLGSSTQPLSAELSAIRVDGAINLFGYEGDPDQGYTVKFSRCE